MDFSLTPADLRFQQEVREFLDREATPEMVAEHDRLKSIHGPEARKLMKKLGARGWLTPTWPKKWGGLDGTNIQKLIVFDELGCRGLHSTFIAAQMAGPILMMFGSQELQQEFLPGISQGEIEFSLGYTEPQAGSDMASLDIRAVEDGDYYVINGQKMFSTFTHCAEYHWLGVRTSTEGPKHRGISLMLVDLKNPGITVRPLIVMDGERTNEVFYDNVRVPKKYMVGQKNHGMSQILAAVDLERMFPTGYLFRMFDKFLEFSRAAVRDGQPFKNDPLVRQKTAQIATELDIVRLLSYYCAWAVDLGRPVTKEASTLKLFLSELHKKIGLLGLETMGMYSQLSEHAHIGGELSNFYLWGIRRTIAAGSSEIQRNVIATRGLGLPR